MIEPPYYIEPEDDHYQTYDQPARNRTIELYESMLESNWIDEPLRNMLEAYLAAVQSG